MAAGAQAVTVQRGRAAEVVAKVYMDDPSIVTTTPAALLDEVDAWASWSNSVGLKESGAKLQLTANTQAKPPLSLPDSAGEQIPGKLLGWLRLRIRSGWRAMGATPKPAEACADAAVRLPTSWAVLT